MIYILIIIDILINSYSRYSSFFFIVYLYNKKYKYFLLTGLILDFLIFKVYFINTLILTIIYIFNKLFRALNKKNIYNYILINIFNYIVFIILSNINNNSFNTLILLGSNILFNIFMYLLYFPLIKENKYNIF